MRVVLVNPPNGFLAKSDLAPPLGLLTIAAVVRQYGHQAAILDFNLEVLSNPDLGGDGFYQMAVDSIVRLHPEVIALTSMCMESHVSLEIARLVKAELRDIKTVLGGTHFGAIAREILEGSKFVDFVVMGEGEAALVAILDFLEDRRGELPENVVYYRDNVIVSGKAEASRPSLESLPFPAYDLVDLPRYFALNSRRVLNYEAGRGCIFKCAFCYSPFQYGDAVRDKQADEVVEDLRKLGELGAKHVFFVQDNLLNSRRWAVDLCKQIARANLPLTWSCYVTYPQLTEEVVDWLAQAGCIGVFTGIDAVSKEYQARMNKRFLKRWQPVLDKLTYCLGRGVVPTCALILEGPEQSASEREDTIRAAIECIRIGCAVHVNTLSIYNRSRLENEGPARIYIHSPAKTELLMDAPPVVQKNELAKLWPSLFPYHATIYNPKDWEIFIGKTHTLFALLFAFPLTLSVHVLEEGNSIWESLIYIDDAFVSWLRQTRPEERRAAALEKFCENFSLQPLPERVRKAFGVESALLRLSQCKGSRTLNLSVDGSTRAYNLRWFVDISAHQQNYGAGGGEVIYSVPLASEASASRYDFVLRLGQDKIKCLSLNYSLARILWQCEEAVNSGTPLQLQKSSVIQLENEGWIWQ